MPPSTPWALIAAGLLLAIGTWGAIQAGMSGADFMHDLELPRPALARNPPLIVDTGVRPLAGRVVIVIIDGLRADVSEQLPFLNELRAKGAWGRASSEYPTWSRPNYVNILTGVPPMYSGVRTNRFYSVVALDSLMDRARDRKLHTGWASDYSPVPRMFLRKGQGDDTALIDAMDDVTADAWRKSIRSDQESDFDDPRYEPWPGGFRDAGRTVVASGDPLAVMLVGAVDAAGHEWGGDSAEYKAAAYEADAAVRAAVAGLDLGPGGNDALIVVADHGHSDPGGHGGLEPEVVTIPIILVGKGVVPGAKITGARLRDVAPTAAALLGLPAPGHGLGRTITSALALTPDDAARIAGVDDARVKRNQAIVDRELASVRETRLGERALRILVILAAVGAAGVMAWWLRRRGGMRLDWRVLVVGAPAFFIGYYTLIGVLGQRFSPSFLPEQGQIAWELVKYGAGGAAIHIVAGWFALRRRQSLADRLAVANGIAWLGLMMAMIPAAMLWAVFPAPYVDVPGPHLLILIPAIKVAVACYAVAVALSLALELVIFFSRALVRKEARGDAPPAG